MGSGKLQRLAEREREAESVNETEPESDHPPALQVAADDILERHVDDGHGDERFDERRKPQRVGRQVVSRCDERDGVRHSEGRHHRHERAEAAEWDDEAKQEQQVIGSVQDVPEPLSDEPKRRLVPARIEANQPGIAGKLEGAHRATGWKEAENGGTDTRPQLGLLSLVVRERNKAAVPHYREIDLVQALVTFATERHQLIRAES